MGTWLGYRDPAARRHHAAGAHLPRLPIPDQHTALERAVWLREHGCSYRAIAEIMGHYHGQWAKPRTWYDRIRIHRRGGRP